MGVIQLQLFQYIKGCVLCLHEFLFLLFVHELPGFQACPFFQAYHPDPGVHLIQRNQGCLGLQGDQGGLKIIWWNPSNEDTLKLDYWKLPPKQLGPSTNLQTSDLHTCCSWCSTIPQGARWSSRSGATLCTRWSSYASCTYKPSLTL